MAVVLVLVGLAAAAPAVADTRVALVVGNVALDGQSGNSPYTAALAQTIRRSDRAGW